MQQASEIARCLQSHCWIIPYEDANVTAMQKQGLVPNVKKKMLNPRELIAAKQAKMATQQQKEGGKFEAAAKGELIDTNKPG